MEKGTLKFVITNPALEETFTLEIEPKGEPGMDMPYRMKVNGEIRFEVIGKYISSQISGFIWNQTSLYMGTK